MRFVLALLAALALVEAEAAKPKQKAKPVAKAPVVNVAAGPVETAHRRLPYVGAVVVDASTSNTLFQSGADAEAYPASVTKLMTALLVLEDVKAGRYQFDTMVAATPEVYQSEPSCVGIRVGEKMSVGDLLLVLMVHSANDAAIALAVNSAGSVEAFVERMNSRAKELGMMHTVYYNPNGLPPNPRKRYPWKSFNATTAADQMKLALELVNANPKIFEYTSVKTCDLVKTGEGYRASVTRRSGVSGVTETALAQGEKLTSALKNHNNIMRTDKLKILNDDGGEAVDGLKTGYIDAGGASIIITGRRKGKRVIAVVLGSASAKARDEAARQLLLDGLGSVVW